MLAAALLACALLLLLVAPSAEEKRLTIYTSRVSYSLPVLEREGGEYVGVVEALEPLCGVSAGTERKSWKLRCDRNNAEFKPGKTEAKVRGKRVDLGGRFLLEGDRGIVPLRSLDGVFAAFFEQPAELHLAGRRLFLGDIAVRFTPELRKDALVLNFSAPVNPVISTEPGKLKMTFKREAVTSSANAYRYDNPLVSSLAYAEVNGSAEVTVSGNIPLLASFGDGGKTITLAAAPDRVPSTAGAPAQPPAPAASGSQAPPAAGPVAPLQFPLPPKYVVVLDAGHGGEERGAALTDTLAEKDVTLALARRLRLELQARGVATLMSRDSDIALTTDQRATLANTAHTLLFVAVHAGSLGHGVRIYTAMLPTGTASASEAGWPFLSWDTAQAGFLTISHSVADQISGELTRHEIPNQVLAASVRPLSNIAAPAIAVEMAPPKDRVEEVTGGSYQQSVASAVATAIFTARPRLQQVR
jgi:N-acetylmuramoyl-L-alanine amidase